MDTSNGVLIGIGCTPEQYARSRSDNSIHCLTRGESVGLTVVAEAGLISLVAVSYVFLIILRNVAWRVRNVSRDRWHVFHEPGDLLMFSLFSADLLQAVGTAMNFKWVVNGNVQVGDVCSAQGTLLQLGETAVAITTLIITVYTFLEIWLGKGIRSIQITRAVLFVTYLFIILMIVLGNIVNKGAGKTRYIMPTPYWCWISEEYLQWRIWGEYLWFWITLAFSIAIYVPLWLWSRGNIIIDDHSWWKFTFQHADMDADPGLRGFRRRSLIMLAYPFVYCVSILPLSVVRWISFFQERNGGTVRISPAATLAVDAIFSLSGACNVILLLTTRPDSVLFGKPGVHFSSGRAPSPLRSELSTQEGHLTPEALDKGEYELGRLPSR